MGSVGAPYLCRAKHGGGKQSCRVSKYSICATGRAHTHSPRPAVSEPAFPIPAHRHTLRTGKPDQGKKEHEA